MQTRTIKLLLGFCILAGFFLLPGCEDFLNRPGQGNLDAVTMANQEGVEAHLIGAYSLLDGWGNYGNWGGAASNWMFGSVVSDDAYMGSEPGSHLSGIEAYQWNSPIVHDHLNSKWEVNYDGVNRANATLNLLASTAEIKLNDRHRIEGESIFLRAHYHFELWKMWKNIPYYTEDDRDFRKANWRFNALPLVLNDLELAIGLLPESQDAPGRASRWTAMALKGKVQIYLEDWPGALNTLRDLVDNGPYGLEENFHYVFDVAHNNGPETILAYQASVNDGSPEGENGNRQDMLNFPHAGSPFGCCGFHQPSQNLVNAFKVDDQGLPFLDGSWNDSDVTASDPVDPRLDWTVGRNGVPYLDWGVHERDWIRDPEWAGSFSPKKNIYEKASGANSSIGWANYQLHSLNLHLLRYAELVLMLAEAEIEIGSLENARLLINQIRTRAGQGAQGPEEGPVVVPLDDPSISWATYRIGLYPAAGWNEDMARAALKMERRLELALEGHRIFDLRRWGEAKETLNAYLDVEKTKRLYLIGTVPYEDKHDLYPIPQMQIDLSRANDRNGLIQNPGW